MWLKQEKKGFDLQINFPYYFIFVYLILLVYLKISKRSTYFNEKTKQKIVSDQSIV